MSEPLEPPCSQRYDGVTPRHAYCPACEYTFGGVPIEKGRVVCPECGHVFVFSLAPPSAGLATSGGLSLLFGVTTSLIAGVVAGWLASPAVGALVGIAILAFLLLTRALRTRLLSA